MIKILVIIAFIVIIGSLGSALFYLINNKGQQPSAKLVRALTMRIMLSVLLFIFIFAAIALGWLKPHGIGSRIHKAPMPATERKNLN